MLVGGGGWHSLASQGRSDAAFHRMLRGSGHGSQSLHFKIFGLGLGSDSKCMS